MSKQLVEKYKQIRISDFDYELDESRIAKHPLEKRDDSKLLIYKDKEVVTSKFSLISKELTSNDLLIYNNTKVIQARLLFTKKTGGKIEVFLLNPVEPSDYQLSFSNTSNVVWNCIIGNQKRWKNEVLSIRIEELNIDLNAIQLTRTDEGTLVRFEWKNNCVSFAQMLEYVGQMPIPPYLNRDIDEDDKIRYQTVFALPEGSVAAPTAGLHFTKELINELKDTGVEFDNITLHVGAGTFKPVKCETIVDHEMHTERIIVDKLLIDKLLSSKKSVCAVGTTSLRTLESIYWLGVKLLEKAIFDDDLTVHQWDAYSLRNDYSVEDAFNAIKMWMHQNKRNYFSANTQLIILPGYSFKVVEKLITNFHQPRSTLLLLVAAFIGDDWKKVYNYALDNNFRFLSYGDSSLLIRKT